MRSDRTPAVYRIERKLPDETATAALGHELSLFAARGDFICLEGDLGTGKTTLARALINGLLPGGHSIDVPSPTFTLIQLYDDLRVPVAHCDLYRLSDAREADELGLEDLADSHLTMIEWPDRLGDELPADRLTVTLAMDGEARNATLTGYGRMAGKLQRLDEVAEFLDDYFAAQGISGAQRSFFQGDASSRRYEKLDLGGGRVELLMDMPDVPDGPPVKGGRPYSAIAHLATGITAVIGVNSQLRQAGLNAPDTLAYDLKAGLATIEHFDGRVYGDMMAAGEDMAEPLEAAVRVLAEIARLDWPGSATLPCGTVHTVAPFDIEAFLIEASLLVDWFWPSAKGGPVPPDVRDDFETVWRDLYPVAQPDKPVWMLRDVHSPNLIWLPQNEGQERVGLIDTQDAVLGHPAYDLVSMLQDARTDIAAETEQPLLSLYCDLRRQAKPDFDEAKFKTAYAVLGAQRATKILGIFVRLNDRDGKPHYLRHIPRVSGYLERNLKHPGLAALRTWYDKHLPAKMRLTKGN